MEDYIKNLEEDCCVDPDLIDYMDPSLVNIIVDRYTKDIPKSCNECNSISEEDCHKCPNYLYW